MVVDARTMTMCVLYTYPTALLQTYGTLTHPYILVHVHSEMHIGMTSMQQTRTDDACIAR